MRPSIKPAIIIPTFNERDNILNLITSIKTVVPQSRIIIVDDNSPDRTSTVVKSILRQNKFLKLIHRHHKAGRGSAVLAGFSTALKDKSITHFIEMDADFSHHPQELKSMFQTASSHPVVIAARYLPQSQILNWPIERRIFSKCANFFARTILQVPICDYTNGFRCYERSVLEKIDITTLCETGYALLMEMAYRIHKLNIPITQIPTCFVNRKRGRSNTTLKEIFNALQAPLRIRFHHS